jgi:hypothetical protein
LLQRAFGNVKSGGWVVFASQESLQPYPPDSKTLSASKFIADTNLESWKEIQSEVRVNNLRQSTLNIRHKISGESQVDIHAALGSIVVHSLTTNDSNDAKILGTLGCDITTNS